MLKPELDRSPSRRLHVPVWLVLALCLSCLSLGAYVAGQPDGTEVSEETSFTPSSAVSAVFYEPYRAASGLACRLIGREVCDRPAPAVDPIEIVPDTHWSNYADYGAYDDAYAYEPITITYDPYWPTSYLRYEVCSDGRVRLSEDSLWSCYRGVYRLSEF